MSGCKILLIILILYIAYNMFIKSGFTNYYKIGKPTTIPDEYQKY